MVEVPMTMRDAAVLYTALERPEDGRMTFENLRNWVEKRTELRGARIFAAALPAICALFPGPSTQIRLGTSEIAELAEKCPEIAAMAAIFRFLADAAGIVNERTVLRASLAECEELHRWVGGLEASRQVECLSSCLHTSSSLITSLEAFLAVRTPVEFARFVGNLAAFCYSGTQLHVSVRSRRSSGAKFCSLTPAAALDLFGSGDVGSVEFGSANSCLNYSGHAGIAGGCCPAGFVEACCARSQEAAALLDGGDSCQSGGVVVLRALLNTFWHPGEIRALLGGFFANAELSDEARDEKRFQPSNNGANRDLVKIENGCAQILTKTEIFTIRKLLAEQPPPSAETVRNVIKGIFARLIAVGPTGPRVQVPATKDGLRTAFCSGERLFTLTRAILSGGSRDAETDVPAAAYLFFVGLVGADAQTFAPLTWALATVIGGGVEAVTSGAERAKRVPMGSRERTFCDAQTQVHDASACAAAANSSRRVSGAFASIPMSTFTNLQSLNVSSLHKELRALVSALLRKAEESQAMCATRSAEVAQLQTRLKETLVAITGPKSASRGAQTDEVINVSTASQTTDVISPRGVSATSQTPDALEAASLEALEHLADSLLEASVDNCGGASEVQHKTGPFQASEDASSNSHVLVPARVILEFAERRRQQLNQAIAEGCRSLTEAKSVIQVLRRQVDESCPAVAYEKQRSEISQLVIQNRQLVAQSSALEQKAAELEQQLNAKVEQVQRLANENMEYERTIAQLQQKFAAAERISRNYMTASPQRKPANVQENSSKQCAYSLTQSQYDVPPYSMTREEFIQKNTKYQNNCNVQQPETVFVKKLAFMLRTPEVLAVLIPDPVDLRSAMTDYELQRAVITNFYNNFCDTHKTVGLIKEQLKAILDRRLKVVGNELK